MNGIHTGQIPTSVQASRVGEVSVVEEPFILSYAYPKERVLFSAARDANPFFHLYESLWMLAGRNNIAPLDWYSSGYAKQVRDGDSPYANGAYGYRWRNGVDQLQILIEHLKRMPISRRAVLQMWNVEDDLLKIEKSKDVCCNTCIYFLIDNIGGHRQDGSPAPVFLNMTVCNRSNDLVWGMLGANVVHFSFLQEYMAANLGIEVGVYNQFTNNLHFYTERWNPDRWLKDHRDYQRELNLVPLISDAAVFEEELPEFVERNAGPPDTRTYCEPFLNSVAQPMSQAFYAHKIRNGAALERCSHIAADDWRIAATEWIQRRQK